MDGSRDGSGNERVDGETVRVQYEWSTSVPATAVVDAVAAAARRDPLEFASLYEFVDPDALNSLVRSSGLSDSGTTVSFVFEGYKVTLHSDGELLVRPVVSA